MSTEKTNPNTAIPLSDTALEDVAGGGASPMQTFMDTARRNFDAVQKNAQKVAGAQQQIAAMQNLFKGK